MTCHDTRERLSDWLDEALDGPERAEVQAHLDGCADCRRELDRLRATVSLLSRVEHPRAPVGFVDRVMAAARPVPWYRRLGRLLFLPLSLKLPVEAAAMLVVALLGVYLLQRTPELRDAARPDLPAVQAPAVPASPPAPPSSPSGTALSAPPAQAPASPPVAAPTERDALFRKGAPSAPGAASEPAKIARSVEQAEPPAEARQERKKEAAPAPARNAVERPASEAEAPSAAAPKAQDTRERSLDRADGDRPATPPPAPAQPSMRAARQNLTSPSVSGRLEVKDRQEAERSLADLLSRSGGRETGRRVEGAATIVEVVVPQAGYQAFLLELGRLGSFKVEGQPAQLPAQVPLSIRISE